MHKKDATCDKLIEETWDALRNGAVKRLFLSTLRDSLEFCGKLAVER